LHIQIEAVPLYLVLRGVVGGLIDCCVLAGGGGGLLEEVEDADGGRRRWGVEDCDYVAGSGLGCGVVSGSDEVGRGRSTQDLNIVCV
jgi:hypothetical protein